MHWRFPSSSVIAHKIFHSKIYSHTKVIMKYEKLSDQNPENKDNYQWVISANNEEIMQAKSLIKKCLNVNRDLCSTAAKLNGASQNFLDSYHIHLENQLNYLSLICPELIPEFFEDGKNTMYIKQCSDLRRERKLLLLQVLVLMCWA